MIENNDNIKSPKADDTNPLGSEAEMTVLIVQPIVVRFGLEAEIFKNLARNGFFIKQVARLVFTPVVAKSIFRYRQFDNRKLGAYIGPAVACLLVKKNAIADLRRLAGHEVPSEAGIGTLHSMYGVDAVSNGVFVCKSNAEFEDVWKKIVLYETVFEQAMEDRLEEPLAAAEKVFKQFFASKKDGVAKAELGPPEVEAVVDKAVEGSTPDEAEVRDNPQPSIPEESKNDKIIDGNFSDKEENADEKTNPVDAGASTNMFVDTPESGV